MSSFRMWKDGKLFREMVDGVVVETNLGKTREELGFNRPKAVQTISIPRKPLPKAEWPIWAKTLKLLAKPEDKGIGDVVARIIGDETSVAFAAWYLATFGKSCGCKGRQKRWNRMYPLQPVRELVAPAADNEQGDQIQDHDQRQGQ